MPIKTAFEMILPAIVGGVFGLFGSKLLVAIFFGFLTKLLLLYFDKEIRSFALKLRTYFNKNENETKF